MPGALVVAEEFFNLTVLADRVADAVAERLRSRRQEWPELMSKDTAAEYIDRTVPAVDALIKKKLIPVCNIDGRTQIRRKDLDRLIERKTA